MIIRCELNIRPESLKRIEAKLCSISEDEDVLTLHIINGNDWQKPTVES